MECPVNWSVLNVILNTQIGMLPASWGSVTALLFIQSSHADPSSNEPPQSQLQLPAGARGKDEGMDFFLLSSPEIRGSHQGLVSYSPTAPCGSGRAAYELTLPYAESVRQPAEECWDFCLSTVQHSHVCVRSGEQSGTALCPLLPSWEVERIMCLWSFPCPQGMDTALSVERSYWYTL